MIALQVLLTLVLALACLAWVWFVLVASRSAHLIPRLVERPMSPPVIWPKVSVIVPARDEGKTIVATCRNLLAEDYPDFEVLVVDDRSKDGTRPRIEVLAEHEQRLTALHVETLPDGWLGKTHAMHVAASRARGEWLLFTEADAHLTPGALRQAITFALSEAKDHLTLLPDARSGSFLVNATTAASVRSLFLSQRSWRVPENDSDAFAGIGAFNLVRKDVLERSGGLEMLRAEGVDDLALGKQIKQSGGRSGVAFGTGLVSVAGHATLKDLSQDLQRRISLLMGCRLPRTLLAASGLALMELGPWLCMLALGIPMLRFLGLLGTLCILTTSLTLAVLGRRRILEAAAAPVGAAILVYVMLRAAVRGARQGGVHWRGTFYAADKLRLGSSVTFPMQALRPAAALRAVLGLPQMLSRSVS